MEDPHTARVTNHVLVLTGTCGSGKSTVAALIAAKHGWSHFSEDEIWRARFHRNRGVPGTPDHRSKRCVVRRELVRLLREHFASGRNVVVDATVHEGSASSIEDYSDLLCGVPWQLRVLHPRLDVAQARDAGRTGWKAGSASVEALWRKFAKTYLPEESFLDTSDEIAEVTAERVLASLSGRES